jgi:hypothetical protein
MKHAAVVVPNVWNSVDLEAARTFYSTLVFSEVARASCGLIYQSEQKEATCF